jgi:hypothetical protein
MRNRKRLQHHPSGLILGLELVEQPRLPGARFGHRRDDLAVAAHRTLGRRAHRLHLALAPHEFRQPTSRRTLQSSAQRTQSGHFVNIDRLADAFDLGCA